MSVQRQNRNLEDAVMPSTRSTKRDDSGTASGQTTSQATTKAGAGAKRKTDGPAAAAGKAKKQQKRLEEAMPGQKSNEEEAEGKSLTCS